MHFEPASSFTGFAMSFKPVSDFTEYFTTPDRSKISHAKQSSKSFEKIFEETASRPDITPAQQARVMAETARLRMMAGLFTDDPNGATQPLIPNIDNLRSAAVHHYRAQEYKSAQTADTASSTASREQEAVFSAAPMPETKPNSGKIESYINKASARFGVSPHLIKAVIQAESSFNHQAVSPAGAQGLMQLMPATAKELGVDNPFDPEQNVMGGTRYLKSLLDRYEGDLDKALAAYNWGMGNLERNPDALPAETRNYQSKVKTFLARMTEDNRRA